MAHVPRILNKQQQQHNQSQANDGEHRRRLSDKSSSSRNQNRHHQLGSQQRQSRYSNPGQSSNNSFQTGIAGVVSRSTPTGSVPVPSDDEVTFPPLPPPSTSATSKWVTPSPPMSHDPERMMRGSRDKNYPRVRGHCGAVGPRFANKKAIMAEPGTGAVNKVDGELAQECRRLQINSMNVNSEPPKRDPDAMNWVNDAYDSTPRQCSMLSASPGGMDAMPLGASVACYGVAKSLTEAEKVVEIEKLAVGNGRPRPSSLSPEKLGAGHAQANPQNGEFHKQHPQSGPASLATSPVRPNANDGRFELGQLEFAALSSLGNEVTSPGMISVGCQTLSTVIQSAYSADAGRKGTYQIWFVPDYSDIRSSGPDAGGYGRQEKHCSNSSNSCGPLALYQPQPLTQAQFEGSKIAGSDVPVWFQQCQAGAEEMKRENGASPPFRGTVAPQFFAASSYNANLSFEPAQDNQSLDSPSSDNEYFDQTVKTVNLAGSSPRHLQNGQAEQEHLMVPQAQGCSNENSRVDVDDFDVNRIALQMLEAGIIPQTEAKVEADNPGSFQNSPPREFPPVGQQRPHKQHYFQRKYCRREGPVLSWRGELLPKDTERPVFSEKIFVGGIPPFLTIADVFRGFEQFGAVDAAWCAMGGDKIIPGCAHVTLRCKRQVTNLLHGCTLRLSHMKYWNGQQTFLYDLPTPLKIVQVEVIPWDVFQGEYLCEEYRLHDVPMERKTYNVFLGNLHARFSAKDLARVFIENGCQDVKSIRIGMDKHEYPVGYAKLAFGTRESFIHALRARVFVIETPDFHRRLQIEPFIEGNPCNWCNLEKANMFCRNAACYNYYCQDCYKATHGHGAHPGDAVIRTRRSNKNCSGFSKDFFEHMD